MAATDVFFMARCPQCGEVILHRYLSVFAIHGQEKINISCSCGFLLCSISPQGKKHYQVEVWSKCCEEAHRFVFTLGQLLKGKLSLSCSRTDSPLGYLGDREQILAEVREDIFGFVVGFPLWDFFADVDVMMAMLEQFYQLLAAGKVQCHNCGEDVDMKVYRDRIELVCPHCGGGGFLSACQKTDQTLMEQVAGLLLEKDGMNRIYVNMMK